jgi:hypothetical protein
MYNAPKFHSFVMAAGRSGIKIYDTINWLHSLIIIIIIIIIIKRPHERAQHNATSYY